MFYLYVIYFFCSRVFYVKRKQGQVQHHRVATTNAINVTLAQLFKFLHYRVLTESIPLKRVNPRTRGRCLSMNRLLGIITGTPITSLWVGSAVVETIFTILDFSSFFFLHFFPLLIKGQFIWWVQTVYLNFGGKTDVCNQAMHGLYKSENLGCIYVIMLDCQSCRVV